MTAKEAKDREEGGLGQAALKRGAALAALAMRDADTWQKLAVYCCYLVVCVAIVAVLIPPYESAKQLTCVLVIVLPLFGAVLLVVLQYRRLSGKDLARHPVLDARPPERHCPGGGDSG